MEFGMYASIIIIRENTVSGTNEIIAINCGNVVPCPIESCKRSDFQREHGGYHIRSWCLHCFLRETTIPDYIGEFIVFFVQNFHYRTFFFPLLPLRNAPWPIVVPFEMSPTKVDKLGEIPLQMTWFTCKYQQQSWLVNVWNLPLGNSTVDTQLTGALNVCCQKVDSM